MSFINFMPTFHVLELNICHAHLVGHAIAQTPCYSTAPDGKNVGTVATVTKNGYKFIENGVIVGLGYDGVLSNYDATKHAMPCLIANDELITGPLNRLCDYAEAVEDKKAAYMRALPLYLGDVFTTDNFSGTAANGFAKVVNGILTIQSAADDDTLFIATKTTMPNGTVGVEFQYVGSIKAGE